MYKRECPECKRDLFYKSNSALWLSNKKRSECKSCARSGSKNPMHGKKGVLNPFFGKKHNEQTLLKLREFDHSYTKTDSFREKMKTASFWNDPRSKRSTYVKFIEKYGERLGKEKYEILLTNRSNRMIGSGNPMFGKPSPQGSGNGFSGWYKNWFFRSLRELMFMIKVIERFNFDWKTGECKSIKISYIDWKGTERNYFPDFVLNNKYVVEIKPKRLWFSDAVKRKKEAALMWCEANNFSYRLFDIKKIDYDLVRFLHDAGQIKFTDRYEKKYEEFMEKIKCNKK